MSTVMESPIWSSPRHKTLAFQTCAEERRITAFFWATETEVLQRTDFRERVLVQRRIWFWRSRWTRERLRGRLRWRWQVGHPRPSLCKDVIVPGSSQHGNDGAKARERG